MSKKLDADDIMRIAGAIGGGFTGVAAAEIITGVDNTIEDAFSMLAAPIAPFAKGIVESDTGQALGLSKKVKSFISNLRNQANSHYRNVVKKHIAPLLLAKVNGQIDDAAFERMKKIKENAIKIEYSIWFWKWFEGVEAFIKKYGGTITPEMVKPTGVELTPPPSQSSPGSLPVGSAVDDPLTEFFEQPTVTWIQDHTLQIGMGLLGMVLGEQIAQHPEVTQKFIEAAGNIVPDSVSVL